MSVLKIIAFVAVALIIILGIFGYIAFTALAPLVLSYNQILDTLNKAIQDVTFAKPFENNTISPKLAFSVFETTGNNTILLKNKLIKAEMAATKELIQKGFMHKECEECAIIFVFPEKSDYKFWMKNVTMDLTLLGLEPLDINISAKNKKITSALEIKSLGEMVPCKGDACPIYALDDNYSLYIELPTKLAKKINVKKGDIVILTGSAKN